MTTSVSTIVTPREMDAMRAWTEQLLAALRTTAAGDTREDACIHFLYDGVSSAQLLPYWELAEEEVPGERGAVMHRITRTDPQSGLQLEIDVIRYPDFPLLEWVARFCNTGEQPTPLLTSIQALYLRLPATGEVILHHTDGDNNTAESYHPHQTALALGETLAFAPTGGRPTNGQMPYFNLEYPGQQTGVLLAIGWPGQWAAQITRGHNEVQFTGGQEHTHFRLHPGEQVRTPRAVCGLYHGDHAHAQNVWRRWMMAHVLPHPHGALPPTLLVACSSHQFHEMTGANEANQRAFLSRYREEGIHLDYWWMDAGWYPCAGEWTKTGTWEIDPERFPHGFRPISDDAHAAGERIIVWFEPERVAPGSWLAEHHPEWLLSSTADRWLLLNLGNPDARQWLTEHVDAILTHEGIDLYRQDFNFDPLPYWRDADAPDRQGITEIRHVEGYLAYWDALRARHPHMLIDSCASGGRRNDLETLRRAIVLIRSDFHFEPVSQQCHHRGLANWLPYQGTGFALGPSAICGNLTLPAQVDPYWFRSVMAHSLNICLDMRRDDLDYDLTRRLVVQFRQVVPYLYGDFYPLTAYSTERDTWLAWQYYVPESEEGMIQAFRRELSPNRATRFLLHGLMPDCTYQFTNLDTDSTLLMTGEQACCEGLPIVISTQPGDVLIAYRGVKV